MTTMTPPAYDPIARTVAEYWIRDKGLPPTLTEAQQQELDAEIERVGALVETAILRAQETAVAEHVRSTGRPPTHLQKTELLGQARRSAIEQVIATEIFEQDDPADEDTLTGEGESGRERTEREQARILVHSRDPERWRNPVNCPDPDDWVIELTTRLWAGHPIRSLWIGGALLQTRYDDGQPIPDSTTHPLYRSFTDLLDQATVDPAGGAGR